MPEKLRIRVVNTQSLEQTEPPKPKVVVEYHWERIIAALCLLFALIAVLIWGGRHFFNQSDDNHQADLQTPSPKVVAVNPPVINRPIDPVKPVEAKMAKESIGAVDANPQPTQPVVAKSLEGKIPGESPPSGVELDKPINSTVVILDASIKRAQLTSGIKDDAPLDIIGQTIPMNDKGLIRVYLFMETAGLKGKVLYHDWLWKGKRIAHARIPIKRSPQAAVSSKFIDRIMMGPWEVKIVDGNNRILAKTNFQVH